MSSFSNRSATTTADDNSEPATLTKSVILSHVPSQPAQVSVSSSTAGEASDSSLLSTTTDMNVDNMVMLAPSTNIVVDKSLVTSVQQQHDHGNGPKNDQDSAVDSTVTTQTMRVDKSSHITPSSSLNGPDAREAKNPKRELSRVDDTDLRPGPPLKKKARGNDTEHSNQEEASSRTLLVPPSASTSSSTHVIPNGVAETAQAAASSTLTLLLARPTDDVVLSPLHTFVRKQIEVFTATQADLELPSPGRKNPIQLHQVGLRCIHCRHVPFRDRVKRAVCYPSSLGRVYHSASDMKFDHFNSCKALPESVRAELQRLKTANRQKTSSSKKPSRSSRRGSTGGGGGPRGLPAGCSSSTAQYYHDCACQMGMVDEQGGGVFFSTTSTISSTTTASALHTANKLAEMGRAPQALRPSLPIMATGSTVNNTESSSSSSTPLNGQFLAPEEQHLLNRMAATMPMLSPMLQQAVFQRAQQQFLLALMTTTTNMAPAPSPAAAPVATAANVLASEQPPAATNECASSKTPSVAPQDQGTQQGQSLHQQVPTCNQDPQAGPAAASTTSGMILSSPLDPQYLNPIHCFVRRHVEFFAATTEDITAPSPGRRTRVLAGQVGLRCVHCARLPIKDRVKRAVCYPPSVNGIYHCVSNMKFDHFAICRGLPAQDRQEFLALRESAQGNPRHTAVAPTATSSSSSSSTKKNGKKGGGVKCTGNSTFRYYHDSALRMGLVDTEQGIRFLQDVERTILENKNQQEHHGNSSSDDKMSNDGGKSSLLNKEVVVEAPEAKKNQTTRSGAPSILKTTQQDAGSAAAGKVVVYADEKNNKIENNNSSIINHQPHAAAAASDGMTALMIAASTCPKAAV